MNDEIWFFDVATKTGVCEGIPGGRPRLYSVDFGADTHEAVFAKAALWMVRRLHVSRPRAIWIEAPLGPAAAWGHTTANTTFLLIGLYATLAGLAGARDVAVRKVRVNTVREAILGSGNLPGPRAKKMAMDLARREGMDPKNADEGDAFAGWLWASALYRRDDLVTRALAKEKAAASELTASLRSA
jgi:hypothetical protein